MNAPKESLDARIERLERLPRHERARAIAEMDSVGEDTRAFLREQLEGAEAVEQASFLPGQRLHIRPAKRSAPGAFDFELEEEIGRGSTGSVWKAQDRRLQTTIALKLFETLDAHQHEARERVLREAQAASRVISHHVVRIRDVGELDDGTPFIAMELCAEVPDDGSSAGLRDIGRSLDQDRPRSLREAVRLVAEAAKGVADAHREGVYHRDLKPANILCRPQARRAEIIDFGLAVPELLPGWERPGRSDQAVSVVIESRSGERVVLAGTPAYMAPEQCQGLPSTVENADDRERLIRVDVYGLGATLYALLSGHAPYRPRPDAGNDVLDVVEQVIDGPPPDLGLISTRFPVPGRLWRIVHKAMARNPAGRFRSPKELADALRAFLLDEPTELDRSAATRLSLWLRRNRFLVRTALGLIGLTAVFAAIWFLSYRTFVHQRTELHDTVRSMEARRKALQTQNATLKVEKAGLTEERDRLRTDLSVLGTISDNLQAIGQSMHDNYRKLDRRQRKIRDDQVTPSGLKDELTRTVDPVTNRLAQIESRLDDAVTKEQVGAILEDLHDLQVELASVATLKQELGEVQRQLRAVLTPEDLKPLLRKLTDFKDLLQKLQSALNETLAPRPDTTESPEPTAP